MFKQLRFGDLELMATLMSKSQKYTLILVMNEVQQLKILVSTKAIIIVHYKYIGYKHHIFYEAVV